MSLTIRGVPANVAARISSWAQAKDAAVRRIKKNNEAQIERAIRTAECTGTGAFLGYIEGRYTRNELFDTPIAAVLGLGAHMTGFLAGGEYADHLHAVGDASLAIYARDQAKEIGEERKRKAEGGNTSVSGGLPFR